MFVIKIVIILLAATVYGEDGKLDIVTDVPSTVVTKLAKFDDVNWILLLTDIKFDGTVKII